MPEQQTTEWIKPGARVAVYDSGFWSGDRARVATIERLTATQVVLVGGDRFRRDTLRRVGTPDQRIELRPLDDPSVLNARAVRAISRAKTAIDTYCKQGHGTVADVLANLDAIEDAVRNARAAIARHAEEAAGGSDAH